MADYQISINGTTITATPRVSGAPTFTGTDAYTVIQNAINALSSGNGGSIDIATGTYQLSNELTITGWSTDSPPNGSLKISGSGKSTQFIQTTAGKHAIVVKNKASIAFADFHIYTGASAKSGIFLSNLGANECSVFGGVLYNVSLLSNSTTDAAFHAVNFFDLQVDHLYALGSDNHGILLENNSPTTFYGNSHFGFVRCAGSNTAPYAGLKLNSTAYPYTYINLLTFDNIEAITGYYGIYLMGANANTFHHVDIEYLKYPIYVDGTANNESIGNRFNGGYTLAQGTGATAVTTAAATGGNTFNLFIDGDAAVVPINDQSIYRAPSRYDVTFGFPIVPANIVAPNAQTILTYRKASDGNTVTRYPTPPAGDNSTQVATTAFVNQANLVQRKTRRAVANSAATLQATDYLVAYTSLTASRALTLGSASAFSGLHFVLKDESGSAGTYNITLVGTVNGTANPVAINSAYGVYRFYSNGTAWFTE
ncbi:hypothetical protein MUGA111182_19945 [Mucilaginibacter galii]|uniref:Uncharacterized protein n=1 Tax=Mucilaginibacter galii TaxID=2005073 RepID=A0A917N3C5_9SPHI|nr:hypothetical protein [Mucilaginibacter galii]GGI52384.1 hypothetical protein GCM10011425_35960 [Mucilaginibacter galii]